MSHYYRPDDDEFAKQHDVAAKYAKDRADLAKGEPTPNPTSSRSSRTGWNTPIVQRREFAENVQTFLATHGNNIRNYAAELREEAKRISLSLAGGQRSAQKVQDLQNRARDVEKTMDGFQKNPKQFFSSGSDAALKIYLQGAQPNNNSGQAIIYVAPKLSSKMKEAEKALNELSDAYIAKYGAPSIIS